MTIVLCFRIAANFNHRSELSVLNSRCINGRLYNGYCNRFMHQSVNVSSLANSRLNNRLIYLYYEYLQLADSPYSWSIISGSADRLVSCSVRRYLPPNHTLRFLHLAYRAGVV